MNEEKSSDVKPPEGTGRWVGGAALAAVLASVCCLGPLTLAAVGISAAGFATFFEPLRPVFLGATALLLAGAFYATYSRKAACEVEDRARVKRTRAALWLATGVVALVALFPAYGGSLLRLGSTSEAAAGSSKGATVRLHVEGMTCESCAVGLEQSLAGVPGVVSATVSYSEAEAIVTTDSDAPPSLELLVDAVEKAGYQGRVQQRSE